jgi:hypothetical protein
MERIHFGVNSDRLLGFGYLSSQKEMEKVEQNVTSLNGIRSRGWASAVERLRPGWAGTTLTGW